MPISRVDVRIRPYADEVELDTFLCPPKAHRTDARGRFLTFGSLSGLSLPWGQAGIAASRATGGVWEHRVILPPVRKAVLAANDFLRTTGLATLGVLFSRLTCLANGEGLCPLTPLWKRIRKP